jgi:hypothetical protein
LSWRSIAVTLKDRVTAPGLRYKTTVDGLEPMDDLPPRQRISVPLVVSAEERDSLANTLSRLGELFNNGVISENEFDRRYRAALFAGPFGRTV